MARSKLRLDLKPLGVSTLAGDPTAQWWVTETDGPHGPQRWEFGSRGELDAHLAGRGLRPDQIEELWAQQEIPIEDDQAVAAPLWQRGAFDHHAE
jgi:hypothetical protein